jgi:pimeloyl-ACP methyl ester carboxylesterase
MGTGRTRRWPRRLALLVSLMVLALVVLAVNSAAFNALTQHRAGPPAGLTFVPTGDVRTRVRTWGTTGPAVVLVPGAFETADTFEALGEQLAADHRVYALDLTGTGYSDAVAPFTVDHFAEQVDGLLDAEGLTAADTPIVVGHSSGAAVAGLAALRSEGRVAGVMFLDGDARPFPFPSLARDLVADPFRTSILRIGLGSDRLVREVYDTQCGPLCPALTAAAVDGWRRPLQQPGSEAALWRMMETGIPVLTDAQTDELRDSGVATEVAGGADDPQFGRATAEGVAARIGAPPPTFLPGRHLPMISAPAALADAIRGLGRRVASARPLAG